MLLNPRNRQHMVELLDLKDKICIEIGTREGNFANYILQQKPAKLHLVDIWTEQNPLIYIDKRRTTQNQWQMIYEKVLDRFRTNLEVIIHRKYSVDAVKLFEPESADFIYIDANHSKSACFQDIVAWWPTLKPGGWMCGHDYLPLPSWSGVKPAVDKWLSENNRELDVITRKDRFPAWGVRK